MTKLAIEVAAQDSQNDTLWNAPAARTSGIGPQADIACRLSDVCFGTDLVAEVAGERSKVRVGAELPLAPLGEVILKRLH